MIKKTIFLPLALTVFLVMAGCSKQSDDTDASQQVQSQATETPAVPMEDKPIEESPNTESPIVARFGEDGIVRLSAVLKFTEQQEKNVMPIRPGDTEISLIKELRRRKLDQILEEEMIYEAAQADGVMLPEASLQAMLDELVQRKYAGSEEDLKEQLAAQGMTLEMLQQAMERQFLITEYVKREVQQAIHVDDDELEPYYKEHIDDFTTPDVYDVHFLEIRADGPSPEEKQEAKEKLQALLAEIRKQLETSQGIEDNLNKVIAFCREHSQDENKQGGSWWKIFGREGDIEPALEDAAEQAPMGEFGSIFELQRRPGYVAAYKRAMMPSQVKPFNDETKDSIRRLLYKQRRENLFEQFREKVKEGVEVTIYEDALFTGIEKKTNPSEQEDLR